MRSACRRRDDCVGQRSVGGTAIAAGISNTYYPEADRTLNATLSRWGLQLMWDALSNELKEFWPDVRRKIHGD